MQKKRPAIGAAFAHARKVEAETGGGHKKQRAVAARYLKRKGMPAMAMAKAGGEGSRGGRVIGHTAQNKPIYQSGAAKTDYGHFGAMDHLDAARAHLEISHQAIKNGNVALSKQHRLIASAHSSKGKQLHAKEMKQLAKPKPAPKPVQPTALPKAAESAPMATRSGAQVHLAHDASHASYKKFSHTDHLDAAGHHLEHAQRAVSEHRFDDAKRHLAISQGHSEKAKGIKIKIPQSPKRRTSASLEREDVRNENKPTGRSDVASAQPKRLQNSMKAMTKSKGEGSRGGHIIGHTRSNAPIYAAGHHSYQGLEHEIGRHGRKNAEKLLNSQPEYSRSDHLDAASVHAQESGGHSKAIALAHRNVAYHYAHKVAPGVARAKRQPSPKKGKDTPSVEKVSHPKTLQHENSAKTPIGKTSSGKSVMDASGSHYAGMLGGDHINDQRRNEMSLPHNSKLVRKNNPDFAADDHDDASRFHSAMARHSENWVTKLPHALASDAHSHVANLLRNRAKKQKMNKAMPGTLGAYQSAIAQSSAPGHLSDDDKYAMSRYQALFDKNHAAIAQARAEAFARMLAQRSR